MNLKLASEKLVVDDSIESINNLFIERGWSDGLPIIQPTEQAVEKMVLGTKSPEITRSKKKPFRCGCKYSPLLG